MTSIALVLGAGGVVGSAYHAGVLAGIKDATGWDPRTADLIVGTSAGSGIAASLRGGLSAEDLFRRAVGERISAAGRALGAGLPDGPVELPGRPPIDLFALLRPSAPWLVAPAFLAPGPVRPGLLAGLLPRGRVDSTVIGDRVRLLHRDRWPERPTWICATRLRDGKRVVFGRDDVEVPDLGTAVQASSAIPAYFAPVKIGSHDYVDGALFSPTNADLVARLGFDVVFVVSPMSATSNARDLSPGSIGRAINARVLAREVGRIPGTTVTVEPNRDDLDAMGRNLMSPAAAAGTARSARESMRRWFEGDAAASLGGDLGAATPAR